MILGILRNIVIITSILTIIQRLLIRPVGPFLYILKMRVLLTQACIKHGHLHARTCTHTDYINLILIFQVTTVLALLQRS